MISGIGFSLLTTPCTTLLAQSFDAYYPVASSIYYCIGSVGLIVFAPLTQFLLTTYGWRNTILLLGAIYFHIVVCAALFRSPIEVTNNIMEQSSLLASSELHHAYNLTGKESCNNYESFGWMSETGHDKRSFDKLLEFLGLSLFKDWSFITITLAMSCFDATFSGWIIYFIPHCLAKGLSPHDASLIATGTGFAHLLGQIINIPFILKDAHVNLYTAKVIIYISGTVAALGLIMDRFTKTIATVFISNALFACGIGSAFPMCAVLFKSIVGPHMFAKAFGWRLGINGVLRYLPGFLVGNHRKIQGKISLGLSDLAVSMKIEC